MLGGYQILDLRNIGLTLSASAKTITDADILDQLRNLREYIEKGHDYSKPLNNSPKCVLIRYRDAKNGEKCEVCVYASITSSNNSLTYEIKAKDIIIEVVFEEKTNDDGVKYYDIKTAKYVYSHDENIEGDLSVDGDLTVTGDIEGNKITGNEIIENMVGYSITKNPNADVYGLEYIYAGVCKNGNKITFVLFGTVTKQVSDTAFNMCKWTIPSTIGAKLFPYVVGGETNYLDKRIIQFSPNDDAYVYTNCLVDMQKENNTTIEMNLRVFDDLSVGKTYFFRYEVTFLLSDNLIPQE
ncbi:MAG: hypothetical protein J6S85_21840 [Methanobrevibacter sp.]|nr:hypothetical protein [Methanobrevibacter sp.]